MQLLHQTLPLLVVVIGCAVFLQPTAAAVDAQGGEKVLKLLTKSGSRVLPGNEKLFKYQKRLTKGKYYLKDYHEGIGIDTSKVVKTRFTESFCQGGYCTLFNKQTRIPLYTVERLNGLELQLRSSKLLRYNNFRLDPRLNDMMCTDIIQAYSKSVFNRGHSAPFGDMMSEVDGINTNIFTNIWPQYPLHNQQAWLGWENYVRNLAKEMDDVFVITGANAQPGGTKLSSNCGIIIPTDFWKVAIFEHQGDMHAQAVVTEHQNTKTPNTKFISTLPGVKRGIYSAKKMGSLVDVQNFLYSETNLHINLNPDSFLGGDTELSRQLFALRKEEKNQKELATSFGFCGKMKGKVLQLIRTGKLTSRRQSGVNVGRNVLDLNKESFSAGCRKETEFDEQQEIEIVNSEANRKLVAYVPKGQTLGVLDFVGVPKKIRNRLSAINMKLQKLVVDCKANYIDVYSARFRKFKIIPKLFEIRYGVFSLRVNKSDDATNIVAGLTGEWALGSIVVDLLARYETNTMRLLLRGAPRGKLTINLQNELNSLTKSYVPIPLPKVSLSNMAVTGDIDLRKGGLATVVVSGSINGIRIYAVLQKPRKGGSFSGAFATEFGPISLSQLVKKTIKVDISSVPFFGRLMIPRLGVTVSSDDITSSLIPRMICKNGLLKNTGVSIPKGLQVFTVLNIKGTKVPLKIFYYRSYLSFNVNGPLPIGSLLSAIPGINVRSIPLPPGVRDALRFQIVFFSFDTTTRQLVVETKFPGTLRYFNKLLTITKPELNIIATLKQPRSFEVEVDGSVRIGNGDYDISVSRDRSMGNKYVVKAFFKTIPISDFLKKFSAAVMPRSFQRALKSFVEFSIHNARLAFPLGTKNLQLHLSGTPVISGYKTVHLSAIIVRQGGNKVAVGFQLGKVKLASLINKITGKNLQGIALLNQELETSMVISPVSLPGVHLYGSKLKDIDINKGVSINALLKWPSNCARDKFCAVAQRVLGKNAKFSLQASIESASSFTLSAGVSNVRLGAGVMLKRAALQFKVGTETSYGIEGSIHLNKYGITLSAGLRSGTRGVVLEGNMQGCWKRAFGADWLAICNLHLLIGIQPTVTLVGALEIGGEVRIGKPSCISRPLIAKGYMGIDQLSPNNNFYYVQLKNRVTMGSLLQAFCIRFRLPRPLADSGYPNGFLSSFSPIGKSLPKAGIDIPAGFRLKGTLNILGLVVKSDVTISHRYVKMNIALSPLRIAGGLLQMYASRRDRSRGPFLKVFVTAVPRPKVDIHASGFVSVLGIQAEALLRVTNTKYEYRIAGRFLRLFRASLHITANYGNIRRAGFRVRGLLKSDFFAVIRKKIQHGLQSSSRAATRAIDNAKRNVNSKKVYFDRAMSKLRYAQRRVSSARGAFNRAMNKLRSWENKVNRLCRIRRCGSTCIGCPGPWRCWKTISIWGRRKCVLKKPSWRRCCRRITNPICITRNAGCKVLRKAAYLGLRAARYLVGKSRGILNAVNIVLRGAWHVVRISKKSLDVVNAILEGVKRAYRAGTQALAAVARFGLGGVFDITELSFDVALSAAATGHFRVSAVVKIFGRSKRFGLNINLRNILSFIKSIGNKVIGGLRKFIS